MPAAIFQWLSRAVSKSTVRYLAKIFTATTLIPMRITIPLRSGANNPVYQIKLRPEIFSEKPKPFLMLAEVARTWTSRASSPSSLKSRALAQ
jgi:hypothetical protein